MATEYFIRRGPPWRGAEETYEVTKFDGRDSPSATYHVWRVEDPPLLDMDTVRSLRCDCPSGTHHHSDEVVCKHRRWASQWTQLDPARTYVVQVLGPRDDGTFVDCGMTGGLVEELTGADPQARASA